MSTTPIGKFTDKKNQPTQEQISAAIGSTRVLWEKLKRYVEENYRVKSDFAFYGKNYGWALRFRKAGKALVSMYAGEGEFTAQVVIGKEQAKEAFGLELGSNTRRVLEEARDFQEGRWLFIKVKTNQDLGDIKRLLSLKSPSQSKK